MINSTPRITSRITSIRPATPPTPKNLLTAKPVRRPAQRTDHHSQNLQRQGPDLFSCSTTRRTRSASPIRSAESTVPTAAFENGDFSALLHRHDANGSPLPAIQIIDPITGAPFANDIIPPRGFLRSPRTCSSSSRRRSSPPPTRSAASTISASAAPRSTTTSAIVRIDHQISDNDKLFGHYAFDDVSYAQSYGANPNFPYFVAGPQSERRDSVDSHFHSRGSSTSSAWVTCARWTIR